MQKNHRTRIYYSDTQKNERCTYWSRSECEEILPGLASTISMRSIALHLMRLLSMSSRVIHRNGEIHTYGAKVSYSATW